MDSIGNNISSFSKAFPVQKILSNFTISINHAHATIEDYYPEIDKFDFYRYSDLITSYLVEKQDCILADITSIMRTHAAYQHFYSVQLIKVQACPNKYIFLRPTGGLAALLCAAWWFWSWPLTIWVYCVVHWDMTNTLRLRHGAASPIQEEQCWWRKWTGTVGYKSLSIYHREREIKLSRRLLFIPLLLLTVQIYSRPVQPLHYC